MNERLKTLYEIDFYEVNRKIDNMGKYFAITKNFSLKSNSHLKMLAHLINNLVESEDYLNLSEETLKVKNIITNSKKENANPDINSEQKQQSSNPEQNLIDKIIKKFQNENSQLREVLQKGENQTKLLKDYFQNILISIQKKENHFSEKTNPKIINNFYKDNDSTTYIEPFNNKQYRSTYKPKMYEDHLLSNSQIYKNRDSPNSLKIELNKMSHEIRHLKIAKENEESGLKEIVKKMIEVKTENELSMKEKDNEIDFLRNKLEEANDRILEIEEEFLDLKNENRELEMEKKKLFKDRSGVFDEVKNKGDLNLKKFKKENKKLKKQVKLLQSKNLKKKNKNTENFYQIKYNNLQDKLLNLEKERDELEEKNERLCVIFEKKMENVNLNVIENDKTNLNGKNLDILKCLFVQSKFIEENDQEINSNIFEDDEEINESVVIDL